MMYDQSHPAPCDVLSVCRNLRASDRRQIEASVGAFDPDRYAAYLCESAALAFEWRVFGTAERGPIALLGVWQQWPGVGAALLLATDAFPAIALPMTRYLKRILPLFLIESGVRRVEVREFIREQTSVRFVELLGAKFECELPQLGADGQTGAQYAWTNEGGSNVSVS